MATAATLFIVATPMGNLSDISTRALETLQQVKFIAAEDTRHSAALLKHFGIHKPLKALHDHNEKFCLEWFTTQLDAGHSIALISDAGTPLIADPGYAIVHHLRALGYLISPIPGPCALVSALSVSGLATDRFCFEGFLSAKIAARRQRLTELSDEPRTLIFYETPHRILDCLLDMQKIWGNERRVCLARELTKSFETIKTAPLGQMIEFVSLDPNQQRGEFVLVVAGAPTVEKHIIEPEEQRLLTILRQQLPLKQACQIMAEYSGKSKNAFYDFGLKHL